MNSESVWLKLTVLRGIAAIYVMAHHLRNAFWWAVKDVSKETEPTLYWINGLVGGIFRFGNLSVLAFFVVSGISIHLATLERGCHFQAMSYFKRRAQRLYPTLISSLLLTAICVQFSAPDYFLSINSLFDVLGTLAFQQTVLVAPFGGNTPYWSLANEGYYYTLYPLLLFLVPRIALMSLLVCVTGLIFAGSLLKPDLHPVIAYFPVWLLGVTVAGQIFEGKKASWKLRILGLSLVFGAMVTKIFENLITWPGQTSLQLLGGVGLGLIIPSYVEWSPMRAVGGKLTRAFAKLGEISFPLYATHYPIISLADSWVPNLERSLLTTSLMSAAVAFICILVAWILHHWVEMPYLNQSKRERACSLNK
jgi:peptidoglycan/LPS O-acetylase OafA/YrhL